MKDLSTRIWEEYKKTMDKVSNSADLPYVEKMNARADGLAWAYSESLKEFP